MMAKISFSKLVDYELQLSTLERNVPTIAEKAVDAGADIVADEIRRGIGTLPQKTGVTARGLSAGFGISPVRNDNGFINAKLGWDGYNENGVANQLMARVMESGTSKVKKHPFVRPAVNRTKKQAEARMAEVLDEEIGKIMK